MTWEPNPQELQQVLALLHHSQSTDTEVQRSVQQKLEELRGHQQFCCYLVYILSSLSNEQEAARFLESHVFYPTTTPAAGRLTF